MKKHIVIKSASCLDMINAINHRIRELDSSEIMSVSDVTNDEDAGTYIHGSNDTIDESYIDELMESVADETASFDSPAVCSWRIENRKIIFVLTGIEDDFVDEYTCPIMDLTGNTETDIDYILSAINRR